ncbi:MAG: late competence development ComFB family protein [Firmicutes bacterium]|nr:late competence development ComFB family protein [Bacillota bacterium]
MRLSLDGFSVHNFREEAVEEALRKILSEEKDACVCPLCLDDMKAMVLNNVEPDYRPLWAEKVPESYKLGQLEALEKTLFNKIMAEAYKAMLRVKAKPRHEGERQPLRNDAAQILLLAAQEILPTKDQRWRQPNHLSALMAEALNNLKPEYSTTYKGRVYARASEIDAGFLAQVYAVVYNAIDKLEEDSGLKR